MKSLVICAAFLAELPAAHTQPADLAASAEQSLGGYRKTNVSEAYYGATGRPLGSVFTIGGMTYFVAPDGTPLGTSTTIDGRKIYKKY